MIVRLVLPPCPRVRKAARPPPRPILAIRAMLSRWSPPTTWAGTPRTVWLGATTRAHTRVIAFMERHHMWREFLAFQRHSQCVARGSHHARRAVTRDTENAVSVVAQSARPHPAVNHQRACDNPTFESFDLAAMLDRVDPQR